MFYSSSAELAYQNGAMASRGVKGQEDKLWVRNLEQRCWLLLLDTIWQLFSHLRENTCAGPRRSCILSRYIVQINILHSQPKKIIIFLFHRYLLELFFLWLTVRVNIFPGWFSRLTKSGLCGHHAPLQLLSCLKHLPVYQDRALAEYSLSFNTSGVCL